MNLLAKVAIGAAIIVAPVVIAQLLMGLSIWRGLGHAKNGHQRSKNKLLHLEDARGGIQDAIRLIEEDIAKHGTSEFQQKKLAEMRKRLEQNKQKTHETRAKLKKFQADVSIHEDHLQRMKEMLRWRKRS